MDSFLDIILFNLNGRDISLVDVLLFGVICIVTFLSYRYLKYRVIPRLFRVTSINEDSTNRRLLTWIKHIVVLVLGLFLLWTLKQDYTLLSYNNLEIKISTIIQAMIIFQAARIFDWIVNKAYIEDFFARRDSQKNPEESLIPEDERSASKTVQWLVYIFAAIVVMAKIGFNPSLDIPKPIEDENIAWSFYLTDVLSVILVILSARLLIWFMTQIVLYRYYKRRSINTGDQYAFNKLFKYVIYVIAIIIAFNKLGIDTTLLLGGAAALLVGLGLGLQHTFNDFFSGILLLTERRIEIGDMIHVENFMGRVIKIGLRTTIVENLNEVAVIVPNSKLVNDRVINYSQEQNRARFFIKTSVAYGTDLDVVKDLLMQAATEEDLVYKFPMPQVIFDDFGNSSLELRLYFFISEFTRLEFIKSRLRIRINQLFLENDIKIPFPQRDIHLIKE